MNNHDNFKILIIDDNSEIHHDFFKILTINPAPELDELEQQIFDKTSDLPLPSFQIDTALQGKEGVEKITRAIKQSTPYALVFVDIRMPPGWDGIKTIKHIWAVDKDIQIVICTAYSDYAWEETIEELGQTDNLLIIKKPFDSIVIRQLACALTRKWQLLQQAKDYINSLKSQQADLEKRLDYQLTHDALTALPNRATLNEFMQSKINNVGKQNSMFAILLLDLNHFKLINDSLSHYVGDAILCAISNRLQSTVPPGNLLARLGGDEFVMVLNNIDNDQQIINIIEKIQKILNKPFIVSDRELLLSMSIGISRYPKDGTSPSELLRNADAAMYQAKLNSSQYEFYSSNLNTKNMALFEGQIEIRQALVNKEFFLVYQPQIDLQSEQLVGVEALIRWKHPKKGVVLPIDFIPIAEKVGLIIPIGEWVLRHACQQNKIWQAMGLPPIRIAVNITPQQLNQYNLAQLVRNILQETDLEPEYLELEITENSIINNTTALTTIDELNDLEINIALDDFGTGYSSLNYLRKLPINRLKIDRSFVNNIERNRGDETIIQAIITIAQNLGLEIVAEGVETIKQLQFLKKHNCAVIQGYYFSEPLTNTDLESLLKEKVNLKQFLNK